MVVSGGCTSFPLCPCSLGASPAAPASFKGANIREGKAVGIGVQGRVRDVVVLKGL